MTVPDQTLDRPVRIAFCITELDVGGAERAMATLVTGLDRTRWSPHLFCLGPDTPLASDIQNAGVPVTCLNARGRFDIGVVWRLRKALRDFRPELLQTFLFHANIAGRIAARGAGIAHVVAGVRVADREHRWHVALERATRGWVSHHVCVSEGVATFVRERMKVPAAEVSVIPNAIDVSVLRNAEAYDWGKLGIPAGATVILNVGRLVPQKGQDLLIDAISALHKGGRHEVHVVIAGEGPSRSDLHGQSRRLGIEKHVHLIGASAEVPALLAAADLFVLSSRWEGMPNVVLEAMAAACPVVAADVEGVSELLGEDERGLRIRPDDSDALAQGIRTVLNAGDEARTRAARGAEWIVRTQSPGHIVDQYQSLYLRLLENG